MRADQALIDAGEVPTRQQARALILAGEVFVGTQRIEKAGQLLPGGVVPSVRKRARYVGRGGEKLAGALDAFQVNPAGLVALDVGASTGGFTDCLLQRGATRVYGVDVGRGQLAEKLRNDARVVSFERTNARRTYSLPEQVDLAVIDVSFISLTLVLPETVRHVKDGGRIIALVKPQFEAGRARVGRRGVVTDPVVHADVIGRVCRWIAGEPRLRLLGVRRSVLTGDDGNREFFVMMRVGD